MKLQQTGSSISKLPIRIWKVNCTRNRKRIKFDSDLKLVYRGKFDDARPKNEEPISGKDLMKAAKNLIMGIPQNRDQTPSLGCNIKWKKGNEPSGFFS